MAAPGHFDIWSQGWVGMGAIFKAAQLGNPVVFRGNVGACVGPKIASSDLQEGQAKMFRKKCSLCVLKKTCPQRNPLALGSLIN